MKRENIIGRIYTTNNYGNCRVIAYENYSKVTVQFEDGTLVVAALNNIETGKVKNYNSRDLYGKGLLGKQYGKRCPVPERAYSVWSGMLARCYNKNSKKRLPTYEDCSVCEEWLNFSVFADWYNKQNGVEDGWQLDKDLISVGNKIYSEATCALVPQEINKLLLQPKIEGKDLPIGITTRSKGNRGYEVSIGVDSKQTWVGSFRTIEEAKEAYKTAKEQYIKDSVTKYKGTIDDRVYDTLMQYEVTF